MSFIPFGLSEKPDKAFVVIKSGEMEGIGIVFQELCGDYEFGEQVNEADAGRVLGDGLWFANAKAIDNFVNLLKIARDNEWGDGSWKKKK